MSQLSPQKRKQRRLQLRDAQRRRRARLKDENKTFLQIILNQELLDALREQSDARGKPMHTVAAELLRQALRAEAPEVAIEAKTAKNQAVMEEVPDGHTGRPGQGADAGNATPV